MHAGTVIRECCGALLSWVWDSEEEYYAWYAEGDFHSSQQVAEGFPVATERDGEHLTASRSRAAILQMLIGLNGRRVLDVGAGTGHFVAAAGEVGASAFGLEPNAELVSWAFHKGRKMRVGGWEDVSGEWDLISLHDVLEHLTRPAKALLYLRAHLSEGGVIVAEVPEWDCPLSRSQGMDYRHIRPLQHLWIPSRSAGEQLFAECGLEPMAWYRPLGGSLGKCTWILGREQ